MVVSCPNPECRKQLKVDDALVGKRVSCRACKTVFVVPKLPGASSDGGGTAQPDPSAPAASGARPVQQPQPPSSSGAPPRSQAGHARRPGAAAGGDRGIGGALDVPGGRGSPAGKPAGSTPPPLPTRPSPGKPAATSSPAGPPPITGPGGVGMPPLPQTPQIPGGGRSTGGLGASPFQIFIAYAQKLSPATFGLALLCFLLPFVHISCGGDRIATFSGVQLALGTEISSGSASTGMGLPREFRNASQQKVGPELWAILALLGAVVGLGVSFIKDARGWLGGAIAGLVGAVGLLLLKLKIDAEIMREGEELRRELGERLLDAQYAGGYYLALLVFIGAAGLHGYFLLKAKKQPARGLRGGLL